MNAPTYPDAITLHSKMIDQAMWESLYQAHIRVTDQFVQSGFWSPRQGVRELTEAVTMSGLVTTEMVADPNPDQVMSLALDAGRLARATCDRLRSCATVWADQDVIAKALEADVTGMDTPPLEALPFAEGAVVSFQESLSTFFGTQDRSAEVVGCFYYPVWSADEQTGEAKRLLAFRTVGVHPDTGMLYGDSEGFLYPGETWGGGVTDRQQTLVDRGVPASEIRDDSQTNVVIQLLHHLAYGSDDTSIAVVDGSHDKTAKRRAKKKNILPDVNVLYLGKNQRSIFNAGNGKTPRRHRVRAHWRHQPYGPGRKLRRWVLVKAHERGTGELDERERVYVARGQS